MHWIAAMILAEQQFVLLSNWTCVPNKVASECIYILYIKLDIPQGNRCWEGLRWLHRDANQEQIQDERLVEISTLLIHLAPKQKSNEWMHLSSLLYPYAQGVAQVCKFH